MENFSRKRGTTGSVKQVSNVAMHVQVGWYSLHLPPVKSSMSVLFSSPLVNVIKIVFGGNLKNLDFPINPT